MKKMKKGFSMKKRLIALLMVVAMVAGALYIGNQRERTAAADESIPDGAVITDNTFIKDYMQGETTERYLQEFGEMGGNNTQFALPTKNLKLALPVMDDTNVYGTEGSYSGDSALYVDDNGIVLNGYHEDEHDTNIDYDYEYMFLKHGSLDKNDKANYLGLVEDAANGVYSEVDLVWFKNYKVADDQSDRNNPYTGELNTTDPASDATPEVRVTLVAKPGYISPVEITVDNTNRTVTLDKTEFDDLEDMLDGEFKYDEAGYGSFQYKLVKKSGDTETPVYQNQDDLTNITNYLKDTDIYNDKDGDYYIYKTYTNENLFDPAAPVEKKSALITRDFFFDVEKVQYTVEGDEEKEVTGVDVYGITTMVSKTITGTIVFNEEADSVSVNPDTFAGTVSATLAADKKSATFTITPSADDNNETHTIQITVAGASGSTRDVTFHNVIFGDSTPQFYYIEVRDALDNEITKNDDGKYYLTTDQAVFKVQAGSNDVAPTVVPYIGATACTELTHTDGNNYSGSVNLTANTDTTFKLIATSGGVSATSDEFVLVYDTDAPSIGDTTLTGLVHGTADKVQKLTDTGVFPEPVSIKNGQSFTVQFSAADASLDTVTVAREISTDEGATWSEDVAAYTLASPYTVSENLADDYAGKWLRYIFTATDKSNQSETKTYVVKLASDKISIKHELIYDGDTEKTDGNEGTNGKEYGPVNKNGFTVKYDITMSEEVKTATFQQNGGTDTPITLSPAGQDANGNYKYTYEAHVNIDFSQEYKDIIIDVTNVNGVEKSEDIQVIQIDMTDPLVEKLNIPTDWKKSYTVFIKAKADADADTNFSYTDEIDPPDTYASGIKAIYVRQKTSKTDTGYVEQTIPGDGIIKVDVKSSDDFSGTQFFVKAVDGADNPAEVSGTFYVDSVNPDTKEMDISVGGKSIAAYQSNKDVVLGGNNDQDPVIVLNNRDNIGVKYVSVEVTRTYNGAQTKGTAYYYMENGTSTVYCTDTEPTVIGKKFSAGGRTLSELLSYAFGLGGADISAEVKSGDYDGTYKLKFDVVDNAGNHNNPELREITFDLINNGPVNQIEVTSTPKTQEGNVKYYDGSADVKLTIIDPMGKGDKIVADITDTIESELKSAVGTWSGSAPNFTNTGKITKEGRHEMSIMTTGRSKLNAIRSTAVAVIDLTDPVVALDFNGTKIDSKTQYFNATGPITLGVTETNLKSVEWTVVTTPSDGSEATTETLNTAGTFSCTKDARYDVSYTVIDKALRQATGTATFVVDTKAPTNDITFNKTATPDPAKFATFNNGYLNSATGTTYRYGQYYNQSVALQFAVTDYNVSSISITDTETGSPVSVSWSAPDASGRQTANATISGDGAHNIVISTTDAAGNTSAGVAVGFIIDTVKPALSTTLNNAPYSGLQYLNTNASVGVYITDTNADLNDIAQNVVRTRPSQAAESLLSTVSQGVQGFDVEADYEITYRATDRAGNVSDPVVVSFRVDKTPPQLTISGVADKGSTNQEVNITYGLQEAFYWDMEGAEISIYKRVDGGNSVLLRTDKFNPSNANASMSQLFTEDGEYSFQFKAADKAGNTAETSYSFLLDANAPVITLSGVSNYDKTEKDVDFAAQINETFYTSNKVEIKGTRKDKHGDVSDVDFGEIAVNSSNPAVVAKQFKEDGIYDISVKATDKAGNTSEQKIHFTIDTEDPEIYGLEAYDGTVINKFNGIDNVDDMIVDLTVCKYKFYLDGVEYDGNGDLSQGSHVFRVEATDEMGHKLSENNEFSFKFDNVAPTILINGIEDGENLKSAREITISLQLNEDTLTSVKLNGKEMPITDNACTFTVDKKGKYDLDITAVDEAGNEAMHSLSFDFAKKNNWLWLILAIVGAVVIIGGGFFFILAKKRRSDDRR